jgi:hypothetical protein
MMSALLLLLGTAHATTFTSALGLADLAARSDQAVQGRVVSLEPVLRAERIWTLARVDVAGGPDVDVWVLGGCLPERDLCMTVAGSPRPEVGERVFTFVSEGRVTGLAQGWFVLHGEDAVRDLSGLVFADGRAPVASVRVAELLEAARAIPRR